MDFCEFLCPLSMAGAASLVVARVVLWPIHRAARAADLEYPSAPPARRPQFQLSDLLLLVFYVSLGLGAGHATEAVLPRDIRGELETWRQFLLQGSIALFLLALWWIGIRLLHRAQVRRRSMRIMLLTMLPLVYLASFVLSAAAMALVLMAFLGPSANAFCSVVVGLAGSGTVLFVAYNLAQIVAAAREAAVAPPDDVSKPSDPSLPPDEHLPS